MTELELARTALKGHTLALSKCGQILFCDARGVLPMVEYIQSGVNLKGYSVADAVVGKAAAMLFIKAGIAEVYAEVISADGKKILEEHGVPYSFGTATDKIINRIGTDICPMEKALTGVSDVEKGYEIIIETLKKLQKKEV